MLLVGTGVVNSCGKRVVTISRSVPGFVGSSVEWWVLMSAGGAVLLSEGWSVVLKNGFPVVARILGVACGELEGLEVDDEFADLFTML